MMDCFTLITGATSGIGLKTARDLAARKSKLIIVGRSKEKLDLLISDIGDEHLSFCCDFNSTGEIASRLSEFLKLNNVLVNKVIHCAGVDQTLPIKSLNANLIGNLMRVNFYSIVEILSVLLKHSINRSCLVNIIFVSSICSIRGFKAKGSYSASKAALDSYMKVLSKELAPKTIVNSILPGAVPTPMSANIFDNLKTVKHFEDIYPLGIGSVEKVVALIVLYHDMDESWVTGQQIVIDGGVSV
jgi:short-subunit dehydrogenase